MFLQTICMDKLASEQDKLGSQIVHNHVSCHKRGCHVHMITSSSDPPFVAPCPTKETNTATLTFFGSKDKVRFPLSDRGGPRRTTRHQPRATGPPWCDAPGWARSRSTCSAPLKPWSRRRRMRTCSVEGTRARDEGSPKILSRMPRVVVFFLQSNVSSFIHDPRPYMRRANFMVGGY